KKILSGLIPKKRNSANHAVWDKQDLLFLCTWGEGNNRTVGIVHFEDKERSLPQIKMISCAPALEDFDQIELFEKRLRSLSWPHNTNDIEGWRKSWSSAFLLEYLQNVHDSESLTQQLANEARNIKERIKNVLDVETEAGNVHKLFKKFKNNLVYDMTEDQFADMYAQTVVYGLFSARCMDNTQNDFSAEEAIECIPNTNPFLKSLLRECFENHNGEALSFDELEIGNIVELLSNTNTELIIQDFNRQTGGGKEDPVIYFYEGFLDAYEKEQKKRGGVYYTPASVVNFMVRSVHSLLRSEFDIKNGMASTVTKTITVKKMKKNGQKSLNGQRIETPIVQILDPATGTGTFLRQVILQIYHTFRTEGKFVSKEDFYTQWNEYVDKQLLPRIYGYEIMMAPYAVAHMKLAMLLQKTGYNFKGTNRLNVFLTNSLEEPGNSEAQMSLFYDPLADESVAANEVKKKECINVCIGNPPYNAASINSGKWIMDLIQEYKMEPGGIQKLDEKNPKWINDDYVKFIRLCEGYITQNGEGIVAFINPHGFIDNPTFRGMRWNLLRKFDAIYILDLHGNSNRKEKCPDGSKDENVFDIQQGVSINFFIKSKKRRNMMAEVYHADLWGMRNFKYDYLLHHCIDNIEFEKVDVVAPEYNFKPTDIGLKNEYMQGFAVDELFKKYSVGVVTAKDKILINSDREKLKNNVCEYYKIIADESKIFPIYYRPLVKQYIYYDTQLLERSRENIMSSFYEDNVGLITARSNKGDDCSQFLVTDVMSEAKCGERTTQSALFPLYMYYDEFGSRKKTLNLNSEIVKRIEESLGYHEAEKLQPEDILSYIYAVVYSEKYREKYKEFINSSFPRIPFPTDREVFSKLVILGRKLVNIHLMHDLPESSYEDSSLVGKTLEKVKYANNTVYINKTDGFDGISKEIWEFIMCGYQPIQKWLKDNKGMVFDTASIKQLRNMQYCIGETIKIMQEIKKCQI
ncbi:type ISP restriction/modification enzyme, partial [Oribacterium sp. WCC10]|uniref:type ISP restriction/modification enzyme n=1 Tax=Oribacterium sp. WCC10 TaxID=1855343 RepID=UPI0008EF19DB